jgi:hypothetical protein
MLVRYLPVILLLTTLALALAPMEAASQGSTIRTDGTPSDREAHNGVFDRKHKPVVTVGDVQPAQALPPKRIERTRADRTPQAPSRAGVDTSSVTPKNDPRGVEERKDPEP